MKILYIYSDWKWTGPSQPIVELCHHFAGKASVTLLAAQPEERETGLINHVHANKLRLLTSLSKKGGLGNFLHNRKAIKQVVAETKPDVIHCFRDSDLAAAGGKTGSAKLVFTDFKVQPPSMLSRAVWKKAGTITTFSRLQQEILKARFQRVEFIPPWLGLSEITASRGDIRAEFKLTPDCFVVGMVMRVQPHRKFEHILDAAMHVKESGRNIKFLLLGRGTRIEELAIRPAKARGLEDTIVFGGYQKADYWDALRCFDAALYTVAGSDGTARALRQCQAIGKPVICFRTEFLSEIVHDTVDGFLIEPEPHLIFEKICQLQENRPLRESMSEAAKQQAATYDLEKVGARLLEIYAA